MPNTSWKVIPEFLRQTYGPFSVGGDYIKTINAVLTVGKAVKNKEEDIERSTPADIMMQYHTCRPVMSIKGSCH